MAEAIRTGMEYVDGQLVSVRDRMAEAKANENESRTHVLQDVSLFFFLFLVVVQVLSHDVVSPLPLPSDVQAPPQGR